MSVDLDAVRLQRHQAFERRPAGAEVVEQDAETQPVHVVDVLAQQRPWRHRRGLGEFERNGFRGHLGRRDRAFELADAVRMRQMTSGNVDGQPQVRSVYVPLLHLHGCLREHAQIHVDDQFTRLGERHEVRGHHQTPSGMVPARQCLEADDLLCP